MCRRRFFKSYFYIDYNGVKYQNGETVPVSPFPAAGGSVTITLVAARPWQIVNNSWLSISSIQDKSGTYAITLTASVNESYSSRSGSFTANTLDERNRIVVSFSQEPQASEKYLTISPDPLNLGAEDSGTLVCYFHYNGTVSVVTPTWSESSPVIQIDANGGATSNNTDPSPVNNIPVTATYVHEGDTLTATSFVNVGAASVEYEIVVSPTTRALAYGETYNGVTVTYYVITNGVRDAGTDVTTTANYSPDNSATTVYVGANAVTLTGNNTGTTSQDTVITVSYPNCVFKTITVTNLPAVRDKRLIITPDPATINADGTSQMSAVYEEWIGSTKVVSINLEPEDVTWSITVGNEYATIDAGGEVQGTNETYETQVVTVHGYYGEKDVEDTADITVRGADVPTCSLVWDINTFCGDTKYVIVDAYRPGNYEQDDLIEAVGYIPQNVSNISLSIVSDTDGMIDNGTLAGNNRAQYVILINPLNTERHAIVRIEGDGADGNTYHDDLIIFQRYVEPDLLVNGSAIYEVTVTSAFTGNDYTLAWHYADPNSVGIVSYNGFITSCTMGQKTTNVDDGECDITVEVAPNTGSSVFENVVIFSGMSVLGERMTAELHISQEPQYVPTVTITWNYSVHFIGRPPQGSFDIRFDLYNGNNENIWDTELSDSSYDDTEVNQTFTGTTTITVPASTSFAGLKAENNPQYTGQYWETVSKVGNVITTELVVPSVVPIELDIHVQAFSDAATGSFPFEITLQSLSYEDQTPVSDAWITQATTETGSTTIDVLANTGNTTPATLAFQDFRTRMGYWLGIHVDNQDTGTYSDIAVVIEDGTHQLDELSVIGSGGDYMVFVGGEDYDWDNGDLFIKLIDNTQPPCNFELTYPGSTAISFDADPTFYLDYDGNLDENTIGLYNNPGSALINEITIEDVTSTRKKVIVDLEPNCSTSDRLLLFTLSARCGSTMVTATSDQVMQSHSQGYSVTVNEQRGFFVMVQNRLNYDVKLNSFQVYVMNDCQASVNVFQYPGPALTIPANSSVNASDIKSEGQYVRPNDTYAWANVALSDVQNGVNVRVAVGGYSDDLTYSGTNLEARFPLTGPLTLNDSSFILVIG